MEDDKKALYNQIVDHLMNMIEKKEILPGDRLPTEHELMVKFNVSRITAKRALEELKNRGLIYRKQGQGSFLSNTIGLENMNRPKIISMIIPYENSTGRFIDYIRGAGDYLYSKGYLLSINCTDGDENKEREFLLNMSKVGASGIIYYPTNRMHSFDILSMFYMNQYPIVLIDKYFDSLPLSFSISDNFDGGYKASKHLIELGHEHIAFISSVNIERVPSVRDRFLGYCNALKDSGIEIKSDFIVSQLEDTCGKEGMDQVLKKLLEIGVTAVISENDYVAIDIIKVLKSININVPNDISLIGFDNISILEQVDISLTTIEQDFYEIGKKAAKIVIDNLEGKVISQVKEITPIRLIERNSTISLK
ncbi:GntR family transcriptional regulator [Clostridium sp. YIM B02515]|uniref:GntR family transcriptional regulator n=1 Tax=Clostridium rhizosphaerae TaxID=2803861 RepID=A0ABS1TBT3_9CLOT|nr:GntR family transcriptional regulator [Clostridium rhizosphaerae]MBL4936217.1 GntR family transcriptional regulator [Clostridium rhizosphaerae]